MHTHTCGQMCAQGLLQHGRVDALPCVGERAHDARCVSGLVGRSPAPEEADILLDVCVGNGAVAKTMDNVNCVPIPAPFCCRF